MSCLNVLAAISGIFITKLPYKIYKSQATLSCFCLSQLLTDRLLIFSANVHFTVSGHHFPCQLLSSYLLLFLNCDDANVSVENIRSCKCFSEKLEKKHHIVHIFT